MCTSLQRGGHHVTPALDPDPGDPGDDQLIAGSHWERQGFTRRDRSGDPSHLELLGRLRSDLQRRTRGVTPAPCTCLINNSRLNARQQRGVKRAPREECLPVGDGLLGIADETAASAQRSEIEEIAKVLGVSCRHIKGALGVRPCVQGGHKTGGCLGAHGECSVQPRGGQCAFGRDHAHLGLGRRDGCDGGRAGVGGCGGVACGRHGFLCGHAEVVQRRLPRR